jgi:hypothetical protein
MASTCESLAAEIAALRAEIARIPRINEAAIINKAKIEAKDLIMPLAISYVLSQLKPIRELITVLENTLFKLSGQITNILGKIKVLETTIANALKTALNALGVSNEAIRRVAALLARLAPLLSVLGIILNLVSTIATLETVGARVDALERGVLALGRDVSKLLGQLLALKNRFDGNEFAISAIRNIALNAQGLARSASLDAGTAQTSANQAGNIARDAAARARDAAVEANTAINEARQAETKAIEAGKQANDALYETRANRQKLEADINKLKSFVENKLSELKNSFDKRINQAENELLKINNAFKSFQNTVSVTFSKFQSELAALRAKLDAIRQPPPVDVAGITSNAIAAARAIVNPLQAQVVGLASNISNSQKQLDNKFNDFVNSNNRILNIQGLKQSNLSKEFNQRLADFNRQNGLTSEQRFNEFRSNNEKTLGIVGLTQSNLSKQFDAKVNDFKRQSDLNSSQRFEEFQRQNRESLEPLKKNIQDGNAATKSDIAKINNRLKEQERMNDLALPKLDQILALLPLIPARAAATIAPSIPTLPQIETAAAAGTCRTTQLGGCMRRALDENAANINNNANRNSANVLDALNTGANAALLQGQQTILSRLGDQLPGGIGGKLSRFADWMHLDRVLNILIFATTVHNGLMLSNDIGQTLLGAINNVLTLIGLKKEDGSAFDLGSVISGSIENLIKGAIGADNYVQLKQSWAIANRIYQATANVGNSFINIGHTIINGMEVMGGMTGKIGNALKNVGTVAEDAYQWFNPQPNYHSKVLQFFENAQQGASTILQVTQIPIDVTNALTEFNNSTAELIKATKEDPEIKSKGVEAGEAQQVKSVFDSSVQSSISPPIAITDFNKVTA